jgi:hypothetical protein
MLNDPGQGCFESVALSYKYLKNERESANGKNS